MVDLHHFDKTKTKRSLKLNEHQGTNYDYERGEENKQP